MLQQLQGPSLQLLALCSLPVTLGRLQFMHVITDAIHDKELTLVKLDELYASHTLQLHPLSSRSGHQL